ncbi:phage tail protein [Thalassiella azotivora]
MPETTGGAPSRAPDPPFTGHFTFQVDHVDLGRFMEVSGLSVQMDVEEVVEGGVNGYVHRLPGRLKWPNLVLKRGVTNSDELFAWFYRTWQDASHSQAPDTTSSALVKKATPANASIVLRDPTGKESRRWTVEGAYPVKWSGPKLAASSNELALEELEICHRGFRTTT